MDATLERLYAHLAWADDRTLEALRTAPHPIPAAVRLFAHVLGAERVWLSRIEGTSQSPPVWPELTLDECVSLAIELHDRYHTLIASLDDRALERVVQYRNSQGNEFRTSVRDILLQVALHGSYHRGQIAAQLRVEGVTPPVTDYIAFVRERQA